MYDSDFQIDIFESQNPLALIRSVGLDFVSCVVDHPGSSHYNNQDARAVKEARYAAKCYIKQASDKGYAFWQVFEAVYKGRLDQDAWSGDLYRDDRGNRVVSVADLINPLEDALGMLNKLSPEQLQRRLSGMLYPFNPVKRYLEKLPRLSPSDWSEWESLAEQLFGTSDHMAQVKLSRWLIGAVARAVDPGCKMDTALVIRGQQGIGKTSMLAALFGAHFRTLHSHQNPTEQQRVMQQAWGCELGELEATFRAKDISALKAFLTETHDNYRDLYINSPIARPRHSVFAGTTNETAFLNDATGSRRFWVIDAGSYQIPVEWVKKNRDRIWAVAYHLYISDEQHWLTATEEELSAAANQAFQAANPLADSLEQDIRKLEEKYGTIAVSGTDALTHLLGIKPENHKKHQRDMAAAIQHLGYERKQFRNKQLNGWFYVKPEADSNELVPFDIRMLDQIRFGR
ncbi:hypothetical protein H6F90_21960 [Trichocoleus sp. FACHB-591]|uniref:virulence-associated E family protein n=1 Tax=Trichocoleus sp. FACHB-591 TaxID=2692872 RepID=UPI001688B3CA|nr:virulence-associated E family protein [Trichocoleus sp. FACHB-591]MBD2097742.1 hypothetical protein [Trichocoleus sp. FACHB-591]